MERAVVELAYKFDENPTAMFEKVSPSLRYDSKKKFGPYQGVLWHPLMQTSG